MHKIVASEFNGPASKNYSNSQAIEACTTPRDASSAATNCLAETIVTHAIAKMRCRRLNLRATLRKMSSGPFEAQTTV